MTRRACGMVLLLAACGMVFLLAACTNLSGPPATRGCWTFSKSRQVWTWYDVCPPGGKWQP